MPVRKCPRCKEPTTERRRRTPVRRGAREEGDAADGGFPDRHLLVLLSRHPPPGRPEFRLHCRGCLDRKAPTLAERPFLMHTVGLIVNPKAHGLSSNPELLRSILAIDENNVQAALCPDLNALPELLTGFLDQGLDVIVGAGGDGTLHHLLNGWVSSTDKTARSPLFVPLPLGQNNGLASFFAAPDWETTLRRIRHGDFLERHVPLLRVFCSGLPQARLGLRLETRSQTAFNFVIDDLRRPKTRALAVDGLGHAGVTHGKLNVLRDATGKPGSQWEDPASELSIQGVHSFVLDGEGFELTSEAILSVRTDRTVRFADFGQ